MHVVLNKTPSITYAKEGYISLLEEGCAFPIEARGDATVLLFKDVDDHIDGNGLAIFWMLEGEGTFFYERDAIVLKKGDVIVFDDTLEHGFEAEDYCLAVNFYIGVKQECSRTFIIEKLDAFNKPRMYIANFPAQLQTSSTIEGMDLLTPEQCHSLPKVVLHDHLDGGLRPATVQRIMAERGLATPWGDQLAGEWFAAQANKKSLPAYLESFQYTLACMQRPQDLTAVAREACLDLANDNVQYAELRFCPLLSTREGMAPEAVMEAVLEGINSVNHSHGIHVQLLLCAMRQDDPADSMTIVELAKKYIGQGVAGIDLAGPEEGFLPSLHAKAFQSAAEAGIPITIHAGEVCGMDSIASAILDGFAQRLGHGIRVIEGMGHDGELPNLLWDILERNIILEVCPSSNVQTGAIAGLDEHPWRILDRLGFPITLNTDNRLMGNTSTSQEWALAANQFDFTVSDAQRYTDTAIGGAFASEEMKKELRINLKQWSFEQGLEPLYDESFHSFGDHA